MNKIRIYFILLALTAVACNKDELITTDVEQVPIITFDTDPAVYPVKVGREFTITPSYQFVDRAVYSWKSAHQSCQQSCSVNILVQQADALHRRLKQSRLSEVP